MAVTDQSPGKRARQRAATETEILRVAREHLATHGAAALSLRAIARDLGMVSSGLYRYVSSRDDLLTRLIIDAYTSLAQAVTAAHTAVTPEPVRSEPGLAEPGVTEPGVTEEAPVDESWRRWVAIGSALRAWALQHPHDYALIYGSPVPDYQAPPERTTPAGTQVLALLASLLHDAQSRGEVPRAGVDAGDHQHESFTRDADTLAPMVSDPLMRGLALDSATLARGLAAWTMLLGAVSSEVFHHLGDVPDADALFRLQLQLAGSLFLLPLTRSLPLSTAVSTA